MCCGPPDIYKISDSFIKAFFEFSANNKLQIVRKPDPVLIQFFNFLVLAAISYISFYIFTNNSPSYALLLIFIIFFITFSIYWFIYHPYKKKSYNDTYN